MRNFFIKVKPERREKVADIGQEHELVEYVFRVSKAEVEEREDSRTVANLEGGVSRAVIGRVELSVKNSTDGKGENR